MDYSIYKPGQGYWTRVLSAVGAGVLLLATIVWFWQEADAIGEPPRSVTVELARVDGLLSAWGKSNAHAVGGISQLIEISPTPSGSYKLTDFDHRTFELTAAQLREAMNYGAVGSRRELPVPALPTAVTRSSQSLVFALPGTWAHANLLYIKAGVASFVLLAGGIGLFWLFNRPATVDFMIATEAEMRKVNWPARREVIGATWIVICGTVLMAVMLYVVDLLFLTAFTETGVLKGQSPLAIMIDWFRSH